MDETKKTPEEIAAEKLFPGAAIDAADKDRTSKKLVDERTCTLNSNPRH